MRLRHRKWANECLDDNKDIGKNLSEINEETVLPYSQLEIGCGLGGFLLSMSHDYPQNKYLGVEVNKNAFAMAVKKASVVKKDQKNFLIINSPIERLFPLFKEKQLKEIFINFPDPWPKKKQHHRRLSYNTMLKEYDRILKDDGTIFFRTDNKELYEDSKTYFESSGLFDLTYISPFFSENCDYLNATEYENKFRAKGVDINLIIAKKKNK